MVCPGCGEKNRDAARFCTYCGTTLALRCPVCDTELPSGGRFCDSCGTSVDPSIQAVPEPAAPPTASRKVVTVLFADLTGSTALEERMDAESVRSILDRFYAAMRTEVERHSGRVVKFTGDGVMAAFGVPEVHEDDAARAVDAALAMRSELEELASDLQLELSLKIGINTGEVVVSESDDDVVGDAVNVASRLEGAAIAGEVLVGEDTWRLTRATSRYEPVEPLQLKGKTERVPAYRLLSVDERTADSAAAPFVGREDELGRLLATFQDAVDARAARLVTIIGSPGLGKTRLSRELMAEVADVARVRETRCDPAGESTFAPIADLMRATVGISELDTEDEVIAKLAARLPSDDEDRDRIASRAAAILGVGEPGSTEETFWAIRRLIEYAASQQPVVLVMDDIHWAEPLLLDLIEHLAEWIRDAPVLLVGTARPELRDLRPSLAEGGRAATVIALEGLDRAATAQLALNLLETDSLPDELLAKIPASTEGNPLFVRELVRMLVDDGVLLRTADGWSVTVDVDAIQVPPTIQSLLSARVDRLRSDERTILELASVVGKEFYRGALVDLAPEHVKDLVDGVLESLRRKELVEPVGTYWIDEPVYRFHHVLIRDAAYRRLLKESRADVHERVAAWLENKTAEVLGEHDELIGYHLEQAHEYKRQLGRPDDALGALAAHLLGRAAHRALDRDDLPAAAALSGRALARVAGDDGGRSELLLIRCEALLSMGDVGQGMLAAADFADIATDPRMRAWATCFQGHLATLTGPERSEETESHVAAAAAELLALGDQAGAAKAHTVHAQILAKRGRFAECEAILDDALTAARAAGDRRRITATLGLAPHAQVWGPNVVSRAGGRCLDVVRLLRITTGSPAVEATSLRCQAVLEAFRGRTDAARRMLRSARRTLTELGLEHELLEAAQFAGIVELVGGEPSAAIDELRSAYDGFRAAGAGSLAAQSAAYLARAHLAIGEEDEAASLIATSESLGADDLTASIHRLAVAGELAARRGDFATARRSASEAVALGAGTDALFDHGMACRSQAFVLRAAGDGDGATGAEDRARALFERKGATALLAAPSTPSPGAERAAPVSSSSLELRWTPRFFELFRSRDWAALERVMTPDCRQQDRRPGLRHEFRGRDVFIQQFRAMAETGTATFDVVPIAVRGERLELSRQTARGRSGPGGFETEFIGLMEFDERGDFVEIVSFPSDALDDAFAELDERYADGEGAPAAEGIRRSAELIQAVNRADWDAMRSLVSDDFVLVDHRPASLGRMDADGWIDSIRALRGLTESLRLHVRTFDRLAPPSVLSTLCASGVSSEGVFFEIDVLSVTQRGPNGLSRVEFFDPEQLPTAVACFEELTAGDGRGSGEIAPNRSARAGERFFEALNEGDIDRAIGLCRDDFVRVDHRAGLQARIEGRDANLRELALVATDGNRVEGELLATRGDRLAVFFVTWHVRRSGYVVEHIVLLDMDFDGKLQEGDAFDVDARDEALACLEERYAAGEGAELDRGRLSRVESGAISNRCWDVVLRREEHLNQGDVDGAVCCYAEGTVREDRRVGLRSVLVGKEQIAQNLAEIAQGGNEVSSTLIATRGETLALFVQTWTLPRSGFEVELLSVCEIDADGLIRRYDMFDVAERAAAFERLDELFAGGEGAGQRWDVRMRTSRAINAHDWDALREAVPDIVMVDHRPVSLGSIGRDAWIESLKALTDLVPDLRQEVIACPRHDADGWVTGNRLIGTTVDGVAFESVFVSVIRLSVDGERTSWDTFGTVEEAVEFYERLTGRHERLLVDDLETARARFDEIERGEASTVDVGVGSSSTGVGTPAPNTCVRVAGRNLTVFEARDWDAWTLLHAEDTVLDDRRSGLANVSVGREEALEYAKTWREVGISSARWTPIATRGERLAVFRTLSRNDDGFEIDRNVVYELDSDGLIAAAVFFDADALDDAMTELHERFIVGEGAPFAEVLRECMALSRAYEERDWARTRTLLADDMVLVDHRPIGAGTCEGPDAYITYVQTMLVLADTTSLTSEVIAIGPDRVLVRGKLVGPTAEGNDIEFETLRMYVFRNGRSVRIEVFDQDAVVDAKARFDELGRSPAPALPPLENLASRSADEGLRVILARDWDAFLARDGAHPRLEDRRSGLRWVSDDQDDRLARAKEYADSYVSGHTTWLATWGERLALGLQTLIDPEGYESPRLFLNELDENGLTVFGAFFEADDYIGAVTELSERYAQGEGAAYAELIRLDSRSTITHAQRDWDAHLDTLDPDVVLVDTRPAGAGTLVGRDAALEYAKALVEVLPNANILVRPRILAIEPDRMLRHLVVTGSSEDGGEVVHEALNILVARDGRWARIEQFPMDRLDQARARFDELGPRPTRSATRLENAATRAAERMLVPWHARDWDTWLQAFSEDTVLDDRRPGIGYSGRGRDEMLVYARALVDVGLGHTTWTTIAMRGDRLALFRTHSVSDDGFDVDRLVVQGVDGDGLITSTAFFDADDADAAVAELDERFIAGEGAANATLIRALGDSFRMMNAGDWEAFRDTMTADFVMVDHRPASLGERHGPDEHADAIRALVEVYSTLRFDITSYVAFSHGRCVVRAAGSGTDVYGGAVGFDICSVIENHGREAYRLEHFPVDRLDDALARFHELDAGTPTRLANLAARALHRAGVAYRRQDWNAIRAMYGDAFVRDDRRSGVLLTGDAEQHFQSIREMANLGFRATAEQVIATRGDRLVLSRQLFVDDAGNEVELLANWEVDDRGRRTWSSMFDPDDLDAAFDALDERFTAGEGAEHANVIQRIGLVLRAHRSRDWETWANEFADDFEAVDHRPAGWGVIHGKEAFLDHSKTLVDLAPDARIYHAAYYALGRSGATLRENLTLATNPGGGDVEMRYLSLTTRRDRKVVRLENFPLERFEDALTRFNELEAEYPSEPKPRLENLLTRTTAENIRAVNAGDVDALRDRYRPDFVHEDRRKGMGAIQHGPDEMLDNIRASIGPGVSFEFSVVAIRGDRLGLAKQKTARNDFDIEFYFISEVDVDGRLKRVTFFDLDDLDAAYDELDAWFIEGDGAPYAARLHNDAMRVLLRFEELFGEPGWEKVIGDLISDDIVHDDRRAGLRIRTVGRDAWIEHMQAARPGISVRYDPLATRGDRLVLVRCSATMRDGFEVETLNVHEIDADGRQCAAVLFEPSDLDAAYEELDERYVLGEGAYAADYIRTATTALRAVNQRDYRRLDEMIPDDFVFVDHRTLGFGELDREGYIAFVTAGRDLSTTFRTEIVRVIRLLPDLALAELRSTVTTLEGADVEIASYSVTTFRDGRTARWEMFADEDIDAAVARFEELGAGSSGALTLENAATRQAERTQRILVAGDWDAADRTIADDVVLDDRRHGIGSFGGGRAAWVNNFRALHDLGLTQGGKGRILAIRGDRLALIEGSVEDADGNEMSALQVDEVDDSGRACRLVWFDPDDHDSAFDELEARFIAGEGAPYADVLQTLHATTTLYNTRDWERGLDCYETDHVTVDHRPASWGTLSSYDELVHHLQVLIELVPDVHVRTTEVTAIDATHVLATAVVTGTSAEGAEIELSFLMVACVRDGKANRLEIFPAERREDALARFAELSPR